MADRKKLTSEVPTIEPIWPEGFYTVRDDGSIESNIHIMIVGGQKKSGKSTFAADLAPRMPGEEPRTTVIDMEDSWSDLKKSYAIRYHDVKGAVLAKYGNAFTELNIAQEYLATIERINPGEQDVIVVDTADKLLPGFFKRACDLHYASKNVQFAWGPAAQEMKKGFEYLASMCQTLVVISHIKPEYDKAGNRIAWRLAVGDRFDDITALTLILGREEDKIENPPYAKVKHSRLSAKVWHDKETGKRLKRPKTVPALPSLIKLDHMGQPFIDKICAYLNAPDYYDIVAGDDHDPERLQLSGEERMSMETAHAEATIEIQVNAAKQAMIAHLKKKYPEQFPDNAAIGRAMNELNITFVLAESEKIAAMLEDYANGRPTSA